MRGVAVLRSITVLLIIALAGCSASGAPPLAPSPSQAARATIQTATGLPGGNETGAPSTATGLPGTATGLPGDSFACSSSTAGSANCTIAININIAPVANPNAPPSLIPGYHPADLQGAYALPSGNAGGTVAIVDAFDDPAAEADLAVYRAAFGLGPCTSQSGCLRKVDERGGSTLPATNASWSEEIALDLDMVSAACPRCSIVLVEAASASMDDLGAAVDTAAGFSPLAISNSYYAAEWSGETGEDVHYAHPGIAITASSGDAATPSYPAASANVTSVGGTSLSNNGGSWSEVPWSATGHGCSAYVAKPAWQTIAPCTTRSTVDVAAVADPQTGVAMFNSAAGGWLVAGGTSVGSPLVAAAYALSARPAGPAYSYANLGAFRPVGGSGYGAQTGLGSPIGVAGL